MAVNRDTGPDIGTESRLRFDTLPSPSRYDLLLAAVPVAFLLSVAAQAVFGMPLELAIAGGSLLGTAVVTDALFLNPPIDPQEGPRRRHR
jgi:hypothetical protein